MTKTDNFSGALPGKTMGDAPFAPAAAAASGLPVTFSSIAPGVCGIANNTVTLITVGSCTIAVNQSGNGSVNAVRRNRSAVEYM